MKRIVKMSSHSLKLCPECRGHAKIVQEAIFEDAPKQYTFYTQCSRCGLESGREILFLDELNDELTRKYYIVNTKHKVITGWNAMKARNHEVTESYPIAK